MLDPALAALAALVVVGRDGGGGVHEKSVRHEPRRFGGLVGSQRSERESGARMGDDARLDGMGEGLPWRQLRERRWKRFEDA